MRIVLDTNVLAHTTPGPDTPAREVLRRGANPPHILLVSMALLAELSRVLRYDRLRTAHGLTDQQIGQHVRDIEAAGVMVPLPAEQSPAAVPHDPDDDPIVAMAVIGQANVICTWDRHLRHADVVSYCRARAIVIMNDIELVGLLREGAS